MSGNHETEYAKYYLGISNPETERNSALNSALSNALEKAGIENSVIYIQSLRSSKSNSSTSQQVQDSKTSIWGNSTSEISGDIRKQFSSTINNVTLVEEYWDGKVGYALIRIPKAGRDFFDFHEWNNRENRKRKIMGGVKSAVLPGWGSFYQQKPIRGAFFLLGSIASAGYALNAYNGYVNAIDLMNSSVIGSDRTRFFNDSRDYAKQYNIGLISISSLYVWNILDPLLFPGDFRDYYYVRNNYAQAKSTPSGQTKYSSFLDLSKWHDGPMDTDVIKGQFDLLAAFRGAGELRHQWVPDGYLIMYNTFSDSVLIALEAGIAWRFSFPNAQILGIHPYAGADIGHSIMTHSIENLEEISASYDMGYGIQGSSVDYQSFEYRFEMGVQRWFGPLKVFMGTTSAPETTINSWLLRVYNGKYSKDGSKEKEYVDIDSEILGIPELKYGGTAFIIGIALGK